MISQLFRHSRTPRVFRAGRIVALVAAAGLSISAALGQPRPIDTGASKMTVHVGRAGVFSTFGHDHEIAARIARGTVDPDARRVELAADVSTLEVRDSGISDKDRRQIQTTMLGPEVLDAQRYPEIAFRSTAVQPAGRNAWRIEGELTLHGQTRPVLVDVRQSDGHYLGTSRFKQSEFGITPVKVAGGTVKVKDEVRLDFDVVLAR